MALLREAAIEVFPTHVGVNRLARAAESRRTGFPHARGGEPQVAPSLALLYEFSPPTWG